MEKSMYLDFLEKDVFVLLIEKMKIIMFSLFKI